MKKFTITVAKTAGFCFGVDRAVKLVYNEIYSGCKAATLGEIIHNPTVVNDLKERGVRVISSPDEALEGERVVIRSHGAGADVYRRLEELGIGYSDGTCPFVRRIQKIAEECSQKGMTVVIMGDSTHPEVIGIAGHCTGNAVILPDDKALSEFLKKIFENPQKKVAIMPQTTYNISMWQKCREEASLYEGAVLFDTICSATEKRQKEAELLAAESDIMIVIGGRHSSNTVKLFRICSGLCGVCFHVEGPEEIPLLKMPEGFSYKSDIRIGITAGAATPAHIIKEVKNQMSEKMTNMDEDFNFEEALDASFKKIYTGNRVKGYITAVTNTEAVVDVGTKHTGYVALSELTDDPSLKPCDVVKVGDEVEFIVTKINDSEGIVQLSKKKVDALKGFDEIAKAKEEGTVLEGVVTNVVKGGVIVLSNGVRVFIPASQATMRRDEDYTALVGQHVQLVVTECSGRKIVGSINKVTAEQNKAKREEFWANVEVGKTYTGVVKSLTSYGAFVDIGGVDGLCHISELSWNRIKHPSEVVSVGDTIEVYVKDIDTENHKVSLGYKKAEDNPWEQLKNNYPIGSTFHAPVVSLTKFGAFVRILPGVDGLVHISEISNDRVEKVSDVLKVGDMVDVKLLDVDFDKKRISLSMKALLNDDAE